jgi:hypothetical protein
MENLEGSSGKDAVVSLNPSSSTLAAFRAGTPAFLGECPEFSALQLLLSLVPGGPAELPRAWVSKFSQLSPHTKRSSLSSYLDRN